MTFRPEVWGAGHQQLVFHNSAVAALGKAWDRQTGLAGRQGLRPNFPTGGFSHAAEL